MTEKKIYGKRKTVRVPLHNLPTKSVADLEGVLLNAGGLSVLWSNVWDYRKKREEEDKKISDAEARARLESQVADLTARLEQRDRRIQDKDEALTKCAHRIDELSGKYQEERKKTDRLAKDNVDLRYELREKNSSQPATLSVEVDGVLVEVGGIAAVTEWDGFEVKPSPEDFPVLGRNFPQKNANVLLYAGYGFIAKRRMTEEILRYNSTVENIGSWGTTEKKTAGGSTYDIRIYFENENRLQRFLAFFYKENHV